MPINSQEVDAIASLAKLSFSSKEKLKIAKQLDRIMEYVEKLEELDTEKISPTSHVLQLQNVFRKDVCKEWKNQKALFQNAPSVKHNYFSVLKVIS